LGKLEVLAKVRELVLPELERHGPIEAWIIDDTARAWDGAALNLSERSSLDRARHLNRRLRSMSDAASAALAPQLTRQTFRVASKIATIRLGFRVHLGNPG